MFDYKIFISWLVFGGLCALVGFWSGFYLNAKAVYKEKLVLFLHNMRNRFDNKHNIYANDIYYAIRQAISEILEAVKNEEIENQS